MLKVDLVQTGNPPSHRSPGDLQVRHRRGGKLTVATQRNMKSAMRAMKKADRDRRYIISSYKRGFFTLQLSYIRRNSSMQNVNSYSLGTMRTLLLLIHAQLKSPFP